MNPYDLVLKCKRVIETCEDGYQIINGLRYTSLAKKYMYKINRYDLADLIEEIEINLI